MNDSCLARIDTLPQVHRRHEWDDLGTRLYFFSTFYTSMELDLYSFSLRWMYYPLYKFVALYESESVLGLPLP